MVDNGIMIQRAEYSTREVPEPALVTVAIGIVMRGGRVLIARRPARVHLGGLWEFPGGKVAAGEEPAAAVVRELDEELGVAVRVIRRWPTIRHRYRGRQVQLVPFVCELVSGRPRPKAASVLRWVWPTRLGGYRFPGANRHLLQRLAKGAYSMGKCLIE